MISSDCSIVLSSFRYEITLLNLQQQKFSVLPKAICKWEQVALSTTVEILSTSKGLFRIIKIERSTTVEILSTSKGGAKMTPDGDLQQ